MCDHHYEPRCGKALCSKCGEWASLEDALRYANAVVERLRVKPTR